MSYSPAVLDIDANMPGGSVGLLGPADPEPFEVINPDGAAPVLLTCDHASRALPVAYGTLGLDPGELYRHIAWDIGAAELTRMLAERLDCPAVLAGYSRLFIDCNRALDDPTSIVMISDGAVVSGNRDLAETERRARIEAVHKPYHLAVTKERERRSARGRPPAVISIHSFTPVMVGIERPWHIGILWDSDPRIPAPLIAALAADPALAVGDNQPYSGRHNYGYSIDVHGARPGLPHVLIEVRQDLIDTHHGVAEWCTRLADALASILADDSLYEIRHY